MDFVYSSTAGFYLAKQIIYMKKKIGKVNLKHKEFLLQICCALFRSFFLKTQFAADFGFFLCFFFVQNDTNIGRVSMFSTENSYLVLFFSNLMF